MARILAIDYGKKNCGIAVTDTLQLIASGLTTIATESIIEFLENYFQQEEVDLVIIGEPKTLQNKPSESEVLIQIFLEKFTKSFPNTPIKRVDERFTSKMAFQTMIDSGLSQKKRRNKKLIDEISATIILQSYLHYK